MSRSSKWLRWSQSWLLLARSVNTHRTWMLGVEVKALGLSRTDRCISIPQKVLLCCHKLYMLELKQIFPAEQFRMGNTAAVFCASSYLMLWALLICFATSCTKLILCVSNFP